MSIKLHLLQRSKVKLKLQFSFKGFLWCFFSGVSFFLWWTSSLNFLFTGIIEDMSWAKRRNILLFREWYAMLFEKRDCFSCELLLGNRAKFLFTALVALSFWEVWNLAHCLLLRLLLVLFLFPFLLTLDFLLTDLRLWFWALILMELLLTVLL